VRTRAKNTSPRAARDSPVRAEFTRHVPDRADTCWGLGNTCRQVTRRAEVRKTRADTCRDMRKYAEVRKTRAETCRSVGSRCRHVRHVAGPPRAEFAQYGRSRADTCRVYEIRAACRGTRAEMPTKTRAHTCGSVRHVPKYVPTWQPDTCGTARTCHHSDSTALYPHAVCTTCGSEHP
jgi:hypothetical protein